MSSLHDLSEQLNGCGWLWMPWLSGPLTLLESKDDLFTCYNLVHYVFTFFTMDEFTWPPCQKAFRKRKENKHGIHVMIKCSPAAWLKCELGSSLVRKRSPLEEGCSLTCVHIIAFILQALNWHTDWPIWVTFTIHVPIQVHLQMVLPPCGSQE